MIMANYRDPGVLTPQQERAIIALISATSVREAARSARVSQAAIYKWLKEDLFTRHYRKIRRQNLETAIDYMQKQVAEASEALVEIIHDKNEPGAVRVSAIRTLLDAVMKVRVMEQLEDRVEALEANEPQHDLGSQPHAEA